MGEFEAINLAPTHTQAKSAPPSSSKPAKYCYTRIFLLSVSELETCKRRPEGLDPALWRGSIASEILDGGPTIPHAKNRVLARKDRESDVSSFSFQEVPEWRKDSWRPGSTASSGCGAGQQSLRRKAYDEEVGSSLSTSYPPRPAGNWGENGHLRNFDRSAGPSASAPARWEHRLAAGERDRGRRSLQDLDSVDLDIGNRSSLRSTGAHGRLGWVTSERDGLLGSGGGLPGAYSSGLPGYTSRYNGSGRNGRSTEQFQLFKQVKATSHSQRDETDFVNDETFGLDVSTSEERMDQERKRRESFELMRKQQLQQVQEVKDRCSYPDRRTASMKSEEGGLWTRHGCLDASAGSCPQSPGRSIGFTVEASSSLALSTSATTPQICVYPATSRPAVPPGFTKTLPSRTFFDIKYKERDLSSGATESDPIEAMDVRGDLCGGGGFQSINQTGVSEDTLDCPGPRERCKGTPMESSHTLEIQSTSTSPFPPPKLEPSKTAERWNPPCIGDRLLSIEEEMHRHLDRTVEGLGLSGDELFARDSEEGNVSVPLQAEGKALRDEGRLCNLENKASNFSHWFGTGETPRGILSLFPRNVNSVSSSTMTFTEESIPKQVVISDSSSLKHQSHMLPMPAGLSLEDVEKGIAATDMDDVLSVCYSPLQPSCHTADDANLSLPTPEVSRSVQSVGGGGKLPPVFLTCQDIELSIIAEAGRYVEKTPGACVMQHPEGVQGSQDFIKLSSPPKNGDGEASSHLMSLLQRQPCTHEKISRNTWSTRLHPGETAEQSCKDNAIVLDDLGLNWVSEVQGQSRLDLQPAAAHQIQTLESLFGKAFMNELRAQDKPVSMKTCCDTMLTGGADPPQVPSIASHFHQSVAGSNLTSKSISGNNGGVVRQGVSDARDAKGSDLLRRSFTIQHCHEGVGVPSYGSGELWAKNSSTCDVEVKKLSGDCIDSTQDTENLKATCPSHPTGKNHENIFDSTRVVHDWMNRNKDVGQQSLCCGDDVNREVSRNGDPEVCCTMVGVEAGSLSTMSINCASNLESSVKGAEEQAAPVGRSCLASVEWENFEKGGHEHLSSDDGLILSLDNSVDMSPGEEVDDRLTKARLTGALSTPERGQQFQHRATATPQFKIPSGQSHQSVGYSGFQPQPLQTPLAGLPVGVHYRHVSPPITGLHSGPHQLQQPLLSQGFTPGAYVGFSHPPYLSPQTQLQRLQQFGSGGGVAFAHYGLRPLPETSGRSFLHHGSASAPFRFHHPPGNLSQQGGYYMRPVGPVPNQCVSAAHGQRTPFFQVVNAGPFAHDFPLHEPAIGLPGKQRQIPLPLFSGNGLSPHSDPNAMIHQSAHMGAGPFEPHLVGHPSLLGYVSGAHYMSDSDASKGRAP